MLIIIFIYLFGEYDLSQSIGIFDPVLIDSIRRRFCEEKKAQFKRRFCTMYSKTHLYPKLKNEHSGHGSISFRHQQQPKHIAGAVTNRRYLMIILILFAFMFLFILIRYSTIFAIFFPPDFCLNSFNSSSVVLGN